MGFELDILTNKRQAVVINNTTEDIEAFHSWPGFIKTMKRLGIDRYDIPQHFTEEEIQDFFEEADLAFFSDLDWKEVIKEGDGDD